MSDIERAIAYWEEFEREIDEMPHSEILEAQREPVRTALRILRAELEREKNEPLTWDEVVASEGKPVFIYGLEGEHGDDGWSIVGEKYERSGFTFVNLHDKNITNCGLDDLYGKTWIAYRYEPKGEPNV